jgi:hypothetical protein
MILMACLIAPLSAQAQRYGGSMQAGRLGMEVGGGQSSFRFQNLIPTWQAEISVDKTQRVTLHELTINYAGRLDFQAHDGLVYMDVEMTLTAPDSLDLNPIQIAPHAFAIERFDFDMAISGTYVNHGFEKQFSADFTESTSTNDLQLSFANFPASLVLSEFSTAGGARYWSLNGPIELEPQLFIYYATHGHAADLNLMLLPLPPEELEDPLGDSNRDGRFDSGDLVVVFQAGQYEDSLIFNSTWETGDWNGDKEFDSGDLVAAFTAGEYVNQAVAVPEPVSIGLVVGAFVWMASRIRKSVK